MISNQNIQRQLETGQSTYLNCSVVVLFMPSLQIVFPFQLILFSWRPHPSQSGEIHLSVPAKQYSNTWHFDCRKRKTSLYSLVLFLFSSIWIRNVGKCFCCHFKFIFIPMLLQNACYIQYMDGCVNGYQESSGCGAP